jgi:hypothetical protein
MVFLQVDLLFSELVERMRSFSLGIEVVLEPGHLRNELIRFEVVLELTEVVVNLIIVRLLLSVVLVNVLLFTL